MHDNTCIIFDGMAIVQEMAANKERIKTCKDLSDAITRAVNYKSKGYVIVYVIFDDYSVQTSMKNVTRKRRTGDKSLGRGFKVDKTTPIRDFASFLASTATKDSLTLFLADQLVRGVKSNIVTVTRQGVLDNVQATQSIVRITSTHEEADTKMILYAAEIRKLT
ncbi:hypothetical protein GWK47_030011 [Chionoecetes opilio]|uniref:Uncharacterized protein n=1 Tax=Chionoecetes opilio TaxID=41210 RepID=A0A8J5D2R8_CHIOP|nr:hypothetical protein GWK47_030011 [Chionoecetes opilio]